jgi:hypothetical protein
MKLIRLTVFRNSIRLESNYLHPLVILKSQLKLKDSNIVSMPDSYRILERNRKYFYKITSNSDVDVNLWKYSKNIHTRTTLILTKGHYYKFNLYINYDKSVKIMTEINKILQENNLLIFLEITHKRGYIGQELITDEANNLVVNKKSGTVFIYESS